MAISIKQAAGGPVGAAKWMGFFNHIEMGDVAKNRLANLMEAGVTFGIEFYTVKAMWDHTASQLSNDISWQSDPLPMTTTAIMKTHPAMNGMAAAKLKVESFLMSLEAKLAALILPSHPKASLFHPTFGTFPLDHGEPGYISSEELPEMASASPIPTDVGVKDMPWTKAQHSIKTAIPLKGATALGQPVLGTSPGSTYWCVGIGPRLRMAARLVKQKLSIRFEGSLSTDERNALTDMGFTKGNTDDGSVYFSSHFMCYSVPAARVLGSIFYAPGLEFTTRADSLNSVGS